MGERVKRMVLGNLVFELVACLTASAMPRPDPSKKCFALEGGGVECFGTQIKN